MFDDDTPDYEGEWDDAIGGELTDRCPTCDRRLTGDMCEECGE